MHSEHDSIAGCNECLLRSDLGELQVRHILQQSSDDVKLGSFVVGAGVWDDDAEEDEVAGVEEAIEEAAG